MGNKIKLQNLTPDIYYKQSRDFQFIGRLYDIVLNSVKTNAENIYNIPLNDKTDERLIDLMTLTLGFKSRHNYNVKQLTSLCSAFTFVIKNKGNIKSVIQATRALLNAEGIDEDLDYNLEDNNTVLNLFIPQKLTDINLLRDLLVYILPAGMSCNIIREFRISKTAASKIGTSDKLTVYEGVITDSVNKNIPVDLNAKAVVPQINSVLSEMNAKSTPGVLSNMSIYQPKVGAKDSQAPTTEYELHYNIIYITNGGKIVNTTATKYTYVAGTEVILPEVTKDGYTFTGWQDESGTTKTIIEKTSTGDRLFTATWTKNN